ncbi:leucine/isoleucine/valine transporter permease subunit [Candidatus Izimaplasma bacterium HR1]|jgi:branched-chain amino acid transport system permease protein|uniref:branched-chain amino acid ABC transporter permease n=1 Tax=Candidatus Izimoplasma sp. HR1 TaxID=1541959 RepID=UPI0004F5A9E4|nr:leucine/isoleucine/valine transporter permease subunit [Candidatus Izimaplasma bacterium HR1]
MEKIKNLYKTSYPFRYIVFGIILAIIPLLSEIGIMANSTVRLFGFTIIFTVVALGLNLLLGFSGLVSLGTAGFMGLGAYLFVYVSNNVFDGFLVATIITLILAGVFGLLIALLSMKVEGIYLAIATLFIGEILLQIFRSVVSFTGGFSGAKIHHPKFNLIFTEVTLSRNMTYVLLVVVLVLVMIGIYNLVHSRTGRALMAMSRSEHAAQAMGISIIKYRAVAFVTATVLAALGGVLYVSYFRFVEPSAWNLNRSLLIIAMVVVGGFKSIFGTAIGAFVIYGVPELYLKDLFSFNPAFSYIFAGVLIIVVIMFYPYGAVYIGNDVKKLYYKHIYPRRLPYIIMNNKYDEELKKLKEDPTKTKEDYQVLKNNHRKLIANLKKQLQQEKLEKKDGGNNEE